MRKTEACGIRQSQTPHPLMNQHPKGCGTQECLSALRVLHPPKNDPPFAKTKPQRVGHPKSSHCFKGVPPAGLSVEQFAHFLFHFLLFNAHQFTKEQKERAKHFLRFSHRRT
jgi:hypothetical protein